MRHFLLLVTLFAVQVTLLSIPACSKVEPAKQADTNVGTPAPTQLSVPVTTGAEAGQTQAAKQPAKVVKAKRKVAKPKLDVNALAVEYAGFRAERADCLRSSVDAKIAVDIKLGTIRDFGNVLEVPHLCANGDFRTFDEAVKILKAMNAEPKVKGKVKAKVNLR
jgi:hypothetical protein